VRWKIHNGRRRAVGESGYNGLDIYQRSHKLAVQIHKMTLELPKFETYEQGSQVRRASKSVAAQIVEGYCLRKNKSEFVQYLNRAYAAAHETLEHLDLLLETGSLADTPQHRELRQEYEILCKMIFRFMESVIQGHEQPGFVKEAGEEYHTSPIAHPISRER
jgi:four helix bundle protein